MQIIVVIVRALISIHALLAESDQAADMSTKREASISIHALLAESDDNKPTRRAG